MEVLQIEKASCFIRLRMAHNLFVHNRVGSYLRVLSAGGFVLIFKLTNSIVSLTVELNNCVGII